MPEGFKPKEPSRYPWVFILLLVITILTIPWYTQGPEYSKLYLSIPLWVWVVLFWTIVLAVSIMAVAHYLWNLEPPREGEA
ncbi:MAG: hypothetical protein GSR73_03415 [Desulfurococcales archaeon]|nr:hypothetical protein [Desulfurococcales archaeon]